MLLLAATSAPAQTRSGPAGTPSGQPFEDTCAEPSGIVVRAGWWIDAIQLMCPGNIRPRRGGTGGTEAAFLLRPGEHVVLITGSAVGAEGQYIYSIQIHTDQRASEIFGNGGANHGTQLFSWTVQPGQQFRGFFGTQTTYLTSFGMVTSPAVSGSQPVAPARVADAPPPPPSATGKRMIAARPGVLTGAAPVPTAVPAATGSGGFGCPNSGRRCQGMQSGDTWEGGHNGSFPADAQATGQAPSGLLHSCRAYFAPPPGSHDEYLSIDGVVDQPRRGCLVAAGGTLVIAPEYEVFISVPAPRTTIWIGSYGGQSSPDAIGICRGSVQGGMVPGSIADDHRGCQIAWNGRVFAPSDYEVLAVH